MDEPAARRVRFFGKHRLPYFLKHPYIERDEWILPRHPIETERRSTRVRRLRNRSQPAAGYIRYGTDPSNLESRQDELAGTASTTVILRPSTLVSSRLAARGPMA